jgi:poly(A) polymerase/tRNA nucleotidyltransferase (CCA-adding enzyme)
VVDLVQLRAATLDEDNWLRDFTINAISLPLTRSEGPHIVAQPFLTEPDLFTNHQRFTTELLDPTGGLPDIASRQLRACRPTSLQDDPLRILRAVRLAATLDLQITPELDALIRQEVAGLAQVAAERVRDELLKLLATPHAAPWLYYMDDTGILTHIIPELEPARHCEQPIFHFLPVLGHSLEAVTCAEWLLAGIMQNAEYRMQNAGQESVVIGHPSTVGGPLLPVAVQHHPHLSRTLPYASQLATHFAAPRSSGCPRVALFKLATLLHDNAKPQTKQPKPGGGVTFYDHQKIGAKVALQIARRLRISRRDAHYIETVVHNHMRLGQLRAGGELTERAIHRFFRDTGSAGPDVLVHDLADHMAASGPTIKPENWANHIAWSGILLEAHWGKPPERAQPLVNGNDLMTALGIAPGKLVGKLLQELGEAQAVGEITTREEALALARKLMESGE